MLSALWGWLVAFFFTQLFELPIYWRATKSLRVGFFASAITHPVVWFVFPALRALFDPGFVSSGYVVMVALAETFAVLVEAWWLRLNGVKRAFWWSLGANTFSATCGLLLRAATGIL
jgi:hypothetical protein